MTPTALADVGKAASSRFVPWTIGLLIVAGLLWLSYPSDSGVFLDPRSTGPLGTAAMLAALEAADVQVEITGRVPADTDTVVVVLSDHLTDEQRVEIGHWVEQGGRLILLDVRSPLSPVTDLEPFITDQFGAVAVEPGCQLLDGYVTDVRSVNWVIMPESASTTDACFVVGKGWGLVTEQVGAGRITLTGVADTLVNVNLRDRSHGRFWAAMLAPDATEGNARLAVLWDDPDGPRTLGGDVALLDLAPAGARAAGGMLVGAAVLYAWSRARRHGDVIDEAPAVRVPGSELALAIGDLLQRHDHADEAAGRLRADARAEVARALSLPADTPPDVLVEVLASHYPDLEGLPAVLLDRTVRDRTQLQGVTMSIARLRRRLRSGPETPR